LRRVLYFLALLFSVATLTLLVAQNQRAPRQISLPTSKVLTVPSPGILGSLNGFAAAMTVSPGGRYAAILNDGYGSQQNQAHQSIAILNLSTNQLADFPEDRLPEEAHQSYFVGLGFGSDGQRLYASIGSITDPAGEKPGDTGNGIAVYRFHEGQIVWDRFIKIPPQNIATGKKVAQGVHKTAEGTVLPYPAGLAVISSPGVADRLLVANNLSDNVVLIDSASGQVLKRFDLSTHEMIPSAFPYAVVASHDGRRAWCSLWNASRVAELDLEKGTVARWIPLLEPKEPTTPGSHPTAMLLSPDQKSLYVALSNANRVAVVSTETGKPQLLLDATVSGDKYGGTYPNALALSAERASALGYVPPYLSPETVASSNNCGLPVSVDTTATRLAFDNATYSDFWSGLSSIAVGCEPGVVGSFGSSKGIQRATVPFSKSSSATRDAFHRLHQARRPSCDATTA